MMSLQSLRRAKHCARGVLLWFVLSLGMAVASPLLQPASSSLVCSAGGSRWVIISDDGPLTATAHTLNCVLCAPAVVPPPLSVASFVSTDALRYALLPAPASHIAWHAFMLISARGPPVIS